MTFKVEQIRAKAKVNQVNVNWKLQQSNSQKWQDQSNFDPEACWVEKTLNIVKSMYRTRAIITCSLYTFYPPFQVNLCTVVFGLMYGKYSIAGSNQEQVIVARVRYSKNSQKKFPKAYWLHTEPVPLYNPLFIGNHSWILTIYKAKGHST